MLPAHRTQTFITLLQPLLAMESLAPRNPSIIVAFLVLITLVAALPFLVSQSSGSAGTYHVWVKQWGNVYGVRGYSKVTNDDVLPPGSGGVASVFCLMMTNYGWVQVGFTKGDTLREGYCSTPCFYVESRTICGDYYAILGPAEVGSTHEYRIFAVYPYHRWHVTLDGRLIFSESCIPSYDGYAKVFSESKDSLNRINYHHYWGLMYAKNLYLTWVYFDDTSSGADYPYHILKISDREFYAYGGG